MLTNGTDQKDPFYLESIHEERYPSVTRRFESDMYQFVELNELIIMA